jgi:hypothetical protein
MQAMLGGTHNNKFGVHTQQQKQQRDAAGAALIVLNYVII